MPIKIQKNSNGVFFLTVVIKLQLLHFATHIPRMSEYIIVRGDVRQFHDMSCFGREVAKGITVVSATTPAPQPQQAEH